MPAQASHGTHLQKGYWRHLPVGCSYQNSANVYYNTHETGCLTTSCNGYTGIDAFIRNDPQFTLRFGTTHGGVVVNLQQPDEAIRTKLHAAVTDMLDKTNVYVS